MRQSHVYRCPEISLIGEIKDDVLEGDQLCILVKYI